MQNECWCLNEHPKHQFPALFGSFLSLGNKEGKVRGSAGDHGEEEEEDGKASEVRASAFSPLPS